MTTVVEGNNVQLKRSGSISDDSEEGDAVEAEDNTRNGERAEVLEPYVGMVFESEDHARRFYSDYARRAGFVVRIRQRHCSEIDGRTVARRLGCNKQGFSPDPKGKMGQEKKPRPSAPEGCKAKIMLKPEKSGKWLVTRFVMEHTHPLAATAHEYKNLLEKDKKIQELTRELQRQEELSAAYRERLINLLDNIENQAEHLSSKVLVVAQHVRKAEAEALTFSKAYR